MADNYPSSAWLPDDVPSDEIPAAAAAVFQKYHRHYDGEIQGCCLLIADEIQRAIGGEVIAGYIAIYGGSVQRTHWWVDFHGKRIDPMGHNAFDDRDFPEWVEVHRDRAIFESLLPGYEQWRLP